MSEKHDSTAGSSLIDDLRRIEVFADLSQDQLDWLVEHFEETRFQPGEIMGREGEPLDNLIVILEGEIRIQRGSGSEEIVIRGMAGQVTGLLPYSRLTHYGGTTRAVLPTRVAALHRSLFRRCWSAYRCWASDWSPSWPTAFARPHGPRRSATR